MPAVYAFPVRRYPGRGGEPLYRPVVDVRLSGPEASVEEKMLVDSGADASLIDLSLAQQLGLPLEKPLPGRGASGRRTPAWRSSVGVEVRHGDDWLPRVEVLISVLMRGKPPIPMLGRGGFFEAFDVLFRLGPVPQRGMFYLVPHDVATEQANAHALVRRHHRTRVVAG